MQQKPVRLAAKTTAEIGRGRNRLVVATTPLPRTGLAGPLTPGRLSMDVGSRGMDVVRMHHRNRRTPSSHRHNIANKEVRTIDTITLIAVVVKTKIVTQVKIVETIDHILIISLTLELRPQADPVMDQEPELQPQLLLEQVPQKGPRAPILVRIGGPGTRTRVPPLSLLLN